MRVLYNPEVDSILQAAFALVSHIMKDYDASHDIEHVKRVRKLSMQIAESEGITDSDTLEVIELGATLHDVGDYKYKTVDSTDINAVQDLFNDYNYPEEKAKRVLHVIRNVGFSSELKRIDRERSLRQQKEMTDELLEMTFSYEFLNETSQFTDVYFVKRDPEYHTPELCVVQDADRLEALGAIGISRCLFFTAARRGLIHDPEAIPDTQLTSNRYVEQQGSGRRNASITHFYEKIFKLKYLMKTEKGKKMAEERTNIMYDFVHAIEDEWTAEI